MSQDSRDVYVVSSVNHGEQEGVAAVFDNLQLAEHFAKYAGRSRGSKYYVEAWRLNVTGWTPPYATVWNSPNLGAS